MSSAEETKACCAAAYGNDAVALILGESYHPGGRALTRRLAARLRLRPADRVLDAACGPGATARLLAVEFDVAVDGVDLGEATVDSARAATAESGLSAKVRFHLGDAERIPLPDGTDVTVAGSGLPPELTTLAAWVACIADARPLDVYRDILGGAGLSTVHTERHDDVLARMIEQIDARVRLLELAAPARVAQAGVDINAVRRYCALARQAVADGVLGYALLIAEKPDRMR